MSKLWPMQTRTRPRRLDDDGFEPPRRHRAEEAPARQRDRTAALRANRATTALVDDDQLVTALRPIINKATFVRLAYIAIGYSAIGPLAFSYAEIMPLPVGARYILLPAAVLAILLAFVDRQMGWRALVGYSAGIVATAVYDVVRLSLFELGFWDDPIPGIGQLLLNQAEPNLFAGYFWRLFGNGAGMGLAFAMLPWRGWWPGLVYGTAICFGLFATLALFPVAQTHFFPLLPHVAVGALIGHFVYGSVLGWLVAKRIPPTRKVRARARARA